jgi:flavin reductase (DIM6/NTAB) family NADH-FMN oxidoreductase RutF
MNAASPRFDARALRGVFGRFATGVTVVTVPTPDGAGHGMTANSFTSVSLDPPLVLICVDRGTDTHGLLLAAGVFAVSVLPADRADLSDRFARSPDHSLSGLDVRRAATGAPVLADSLAHLDCRVEAVHPGGDHDIVVGRVLAAEVGPRDDPLIFFASGYRRLA